MNTTRYTLPDGRTIVVALAARGTTPTRDDGIVPTTIDPLAAILADSILAAVVAELGIGDPITHPVLPTQQPLQ